MVQTLYRGNLDNLARPSRFYTSTVGGIHVQGSVGAPTMIVIQITRKQSL